MVDAKWLEVFKLPLRTAVTVAIASGALLAMVDTQILDPGPIGVFALPVLMVVAVISTVMSVVDIVVALFAPFREKRRQSALELRRAVRRREQREQHESAQKSAVSKLDYLSKEEVAVVAKALYNGSPTFYTYVNSPPVSMLLGKGLVWTPGGSHHQEYYPFSFHDFVWKVFLERKDEFLAKDAKHKLPAGQRTKAER